MTAMMLLTANIMHRPQHENSAFDSQLVNTGVRTLDKMVEETGSEALQQFRDTCTELDQAAQLRRDPASMTAFNRNLSIQFLHIHGEVEENGRTQCVVRLGHGQT
jgi:hypothetical protein